MVAIDQVTAANSKRDRAGAIDRNLAQRKRMVHQHRHAAQADDQGEPKPDGQALRAQENDFHEA